MADSSKGFTFFFSSAEIRDEGSEVVNMRCRQKSGSYALFTQSLCMLSRCYWW